MTKDGRLTVAGPMTVTPFSSAALMIFLVCASGIPSAIIAIVRIWELQRRASFILFNGDNFFIMLQDNIYLRVLHGLHGAFKGWAQRRKANENIHIRVLLHSITHVFIHRDEDFFMAPVEFLFVVATGGRPSTKIFMTHPSSFIFKNLVGKEDHPYVNG